MTVSYQYDVASSSSGGFTRLLFKWKGSVYKLVWRELLWFSFAYTLLSVLYRQVLTPDQKRDFERVADYFDKFLGHIPLSFVLGVYVTLVVQRWWSQFLAIPWPDKLCHCIALYVTGNDEHARVVRRTIVRYLNLSLILVLRSISMAVKKRFPTLQHLVEGGFMTKAELDIYQSVPSSEFNTYWIPCTWVISIIKDARKNQMIVDSQGLKLLVEEFNDFRSKCGALWSYDWVSIPLVYTQVVTLATYSFFAACVIGRQYVDPIGEEEKLKHIDLYIPIFTFLQFFFYMGLLKVAEALINPFGDDDEDFELNWMIDRHLKVSYLVVDTLMCRIPPLVRDAHYDDPEITLAYTKAAMMYKKKTFRGSVAAVLVPEDEQTMVLPEIAEEDEDAHEHSSEMSSIKTSNSIMNLLTWTASTGSKMMSGHHKKSSTDDVRKSSNFTEDTLRAMESGQLAGGHHQPVQTGRKKDPAAVVAARYPTSAGIRGRVYTSPFGSAEIVLPNKALKAELTWAAAATVPSEERLRGILSRGDSADTASTNSLTHPDLDTPKPTFTLGPHPAPSWKSKSLDMSEAIVPDSRNRSRSCVARLRDMKRKHNSKIKRQTSSASTSSNAPRRQRHWCWSKESLHDEKVSLETLDIGVADESVGPPIATGSAMSLSLPSIHIASSVDDDVHGDCAGTSEPPDDDDDDVELPKLIAMLAKNGNDEKRIGKFNVGKYSPSVPRKTLFMRSVLPQVHLRHSDCVQRVIQPTLDEDDQPS